jgi:hypothetical protein
MNGAGLRAVARPCLGGRMAAENITRRLGVTGVLILTVEEDSVAMAAGLRGTRQDENGSLEHFQLISVA